MGLRDAKKWESQKLDSKTFKLAALLAGANGQREAANAVIEARGDDAIGRGLRRHEENPGVEIAARVVVFGQIEELLVLNAQVWIEFRAYHVDCVGHVGSQMDQVHFTTPAVAKHGVERVVIHERAIDRQTIL